MTVREIVHIGHPVLRAEAALVDPADVHDLIDDLIDTMRAANGAGLAANQIGEAVQVCVIEVRRDNPRYPYKPEIPLTVLINPVIESLTTETFANYEGCLSVPGLRGIVDRSVEVACVRSRATVRRSTRSCGACQRERSSTRPSTSADRAGLVGRNVPRDETECTSLGTLTPRGLCKPSTAKPSSRVQLPETRRAVRCIGAGERTMEAKGYVIAGRASKTMSDALRTEVSRGRAIRVSRGRYAAGRTPRSTVWWMQKRISELVDVAAP